MEGLIIWMLFVHWVADFVCQNDYMAINKSKGWRVLAIHSLIYSMVLFMGAVVYGVMTPILLLNLPAHMAIDAVTSRINAQLYQNHRHWFFVMIGFDQFLHYAVLLLTISLATK